MNWNGKHCFVEIGVKIKSCGFNRCIFFAAEVVRLVLSKYDHQYALDNLVGDVTGLG